MNKTMMLVLVCALGAGVALAQSDPNPGRQQGPTAAQAPASGSPSASQPGNTAQPSRNRAVPNNQPAGSNATAQRDQSGTPQTTPNNQAGGGIPLVWAVVAIVLLLGVVFFIAGGGRGEVTPIDREDAEADEIERHRHDRAA